MLYRMKAELDVSFLHLFASLPRERYHINIVLLIQYLIPLWTERKSLYERRTRVLVTQKKKEKEINKPNSSFPRLNGQQC